MQVGFGSSHRRVASLADALIRGLPEITFLYCSSVVRPHIDSDRSALHADHARTKRSVTGYMNVHARGSLLPFVLLYATLYAGFGVVSPFLPTLLQARGLGPDEIGLVLALSTAVRLVSGPLAGRAADLFDALRGVLACFAVAGALSAFGYLPANSFWSVLVISVIYAAMLAPLTTTADALALRAVKSSGETDRRFEYGWVRGAGSAAFIVGSLLAGLAIVAFGLEIIIWGSSALLAAAAAAAMALPALPASPRSGPTPRGDAGPSIRELLRLREFRLLIIIAALVLGSHAMHDSFAMIRWKEAGISPPTASVLWSESVATEVVVFVLAGPWLLNRIGPSHAMMLAATAGAIRWSVMAVTADLVVMSLIEPLHGLSFALLHLACMRRLGEIVPPRLAATAQAIYGTVAIGAMTALLTLASGALYGRVGAAGFWAMATLCLCSMPFIVQMGKAPMRE
jgi:PPP family 3-phenylpropionic acid transporter